MPKVTIPVAYTDSIITRTVVDSIVKQLMYYTDIKNIEDIIFMPKSGYQQAMSQVVTLQEPVRLDVNNFIKVEYTEDFDREQWDVNKNDINSIPIFADPKLGVSVTPLYSKVILTLNVTYQAKSNNDIVQWVNGCRRRNQFANPGFNHDIAYYYILPTEILAYISQAHILRENISGYGDELKDYFLNRLTKGLNIQSNQSNKDELVIAVRNINITGNFDQYEPPVPEAQKEPPLTTVNFTYVVRYDRVTDLVLNYQHYIHNQVVNLAFLQPYGDRNNHYDPLRGNKQPGSNYVGLSQKTKIEEEAYKDHGTYYGDGWRPNNSYPNVRNILTIPLQIDLNNPTLILNLDELVAFGLSQSLINILKKHYDKLAEVYKWFALVEIYEVNESEGFLPFVVQSNGDIIILETPILRNRHYFTLSSNYDLLNANFDNLDIDDLVEILHWLDPNFPDILIDTENWPDGESIINIKNHFGRLNLSRDQTKLVQIANIIARKQ